MAKESVINRAMSEVTKDIAKAVSEMQREFKTVKPLSPGLSPEEQIWAVDTVRPEDMNMLRMEFGDEAIEKLLYDTWKLRQDKRRHIK